MTVEMKMIKTGEFIAQRRRELKLTQEKLAECLSVTDKAVSKWERGLSMPDIGLLGALALALKCEVSDILNHRFENFSSSNISRDNYGLDAFCENGGEADTIDYDLSSTNTVLPYIFGNNVEHTRDCIHSGLSAEMLENRKFAGKPGIGSGVAAYWKSVGARAYCSFEAPYTRHATDYHMKRMNECNSQRITSFYGDECGIAQSGFSMVEGKEYTLALVLRAVNNCTVTARIISKSGKVLCEGTAEVQGGDDFKEFSLMLAPCASSDESSLSITFASVNTLIIGAVSLMPSDNFHGMRRDVINLLAECGITMLRWPGGNFAGEYNWKDGLLPRNMRAPLQSYQNIETQPSSLGYDFHEINVDDFIALCKKIGAEPYITINPTWNTPEESAQWVEYCNGDENTEYGRLRISRGFSEPYNVKYWSLGNEFGYGHMEGANSPIDYSKSVKRHADAMRMTDGELIMCSSGPYPDAEWARTAARSLSGVASLVALHIYCEYPSFFSPSTYKSEYEDFMSSVTKARGWTRMMRSDLGDDKLRISFDEWNAWYAWYRPENVSDGIFTASMLHMLISESDALGIDVVCHLEAVNEGLISVGKTEAHLTPAGKAFSLISAHSGARLLHSSESVVATEKNGMLTVTLINTSYDEERIRHLPRHGKIVSATLLDSETVLPPSRFNESPLEYKEESESITVKLPPHSVAMIRAEL